jgi:malate permease and related proteins
MLTYFPILQKLIPLYLMIPIGYISSSIFQVKRESIAKLLIYVINPIVIFYGTYSVQISFSNLVLPIIFFVVCCTLSLLFFFIGKLVFKKDKIKFILSFTAGTGNVGYFGIPLVLALWGEKVFGLSVLSLLGFILYSNTLGFFLAANGNFTPKNSLLKVAKLPSVYTFFLGLLLNYCHIELGSVLSTSSQYFKLSYTLLGMMMIGMGLSNFKFSNFDFKFIALCFVSKFLIWPSLMISIILFDQLFMQFFDPEIYKVFLMMSIMPLAANTVSVAIELDVHPEKASVAIVLSTIFSIFFIPLMLGLFSNLL